MKNSAAPPTIQTHRELLAELEACTAQLNKIRARLKKHAVTASPVKIGDEVRYSSTEKFFRGIVQQIDWSIDQPSVVFVRPFLKKPERTLAWRLERCEKLEYLSVVTRKRYVRPYRADRRETSPLITAH